MEIRKLKISPGDEERLRELLKIHESEVDALSDEELDAAERQNSEQLFRLLQKNNKVQRLRIPVKTSAFALLAAAVALFFVQVQQNPSEPTHIVSKGAFESTLNCEIKISGDGSAWSEAEHVYQVTSSSPAFLTVQCNADKVFVYLGHEQDGNLHLTPYKADGAEDMIAQLQQHPDLVIVATEKELPGKTLTPQEQTGLWKLELPARLR